MLVGAGLLAWSAAIHLDLWHGGYRDFPTVGSSSAASPRPRVVR
jgi:hypothetical protein